MFARLTAPSCLESIPVPSSVDKRLTLHWEMSPTNDLHLTKPTPHDVVSFHRVPFRKCLRQFRTIDESFTPLVVSPPKKYIVENHPKSLLYIYYESSIMKYVPTLLSLVVDSLFSRGKIFFYFLGVFLFLLEYSTSRMLCIFENII